MAVDVWELKERQALPLDTKINMSLARIREWYKHWGGKVYVSFSGGKDSTVLLHLVRSIYPEVPAVFVDTGLEYPEIRSFVKTVDNVTWLRPKMPFQQVIEKYGYPVVSKEQSFRVRKLKHQNLTAEYRKKQMVKLGRWNTLLIANFECSEQCCNVIKKNPCKVYEKEIKRKAIIGMMAHESKYRKQQYLKTGCNAFDLKRPQSQPLSFWKEEDVWEYLKDFNIPYSSIYDMGYHRTGCMFCMFGVHLEKEPNRFQRMKLTHPVHYKYCMEKLGLARVLDYIGVPY